MTFPGMPPDRLHLFQPAWLDQPGPFVKVQEGEEAEGPEEAEHTSPAPGSSAPPAPGPPLPPPPPAPTPHPARAAAPACPLPPRRLADRAPGTAAGRERGRRESIVVDSAGGAGAWRGVRAAGAGDHGRAQEPAWGS